jgi:hypothetical protein
MYVVNNLWILFKSAEPFFFSKIFFKERIFFFAPANIWNLHFFQRYMSYLDT